MKNSLNVVLIILVFIVLGCNCNKLQEIAKQAENESRTNSTTTTSSPSDSPAKSGDKSELTLEKYNQIKNGMSYKEVVDILGKEGVETMDSGSGKYRVQSFKWEGNDYKFITLVMTGDKVSSKFQANLK